MITITTRLLLPKQTAKYVHVIADGRVYVRDQDEYLPKRYFSVKEAQTILGKTSNEMQHVCRKLGIQAPANRRKKLRITLQQLRKMAEL